MVRPEAMHARELIARVEQGRVPAVAVIVGAERFFVDRAIAALRAAVVGDSAGFNEDAFEGKGGSAARILDAVRTLPMLASQRLVFGTCAPRGGRASPRQGNASPRNAQRLVSVRQPQRCA